MSASTTPTFCPAAASATARLTVTEDLPTPPLPLATAYTRVSEDGWANGITGSALPPRSWVCAARRCSSLITSRSTRTEETPGSLVTAAVTSRMMVSRSGHPDTVSHTSTSTVPSAATWTFLTMPSSVMGRWISGSCTPSSALVTCSGLGGAIGGELMASCYEPVSTKTNNQHTHYPERPRLLAPRILPLPPCPARKRAAATVGNGRGCSPHDRRLTADHLAGRRVENDGTEVRPGVEVEQAARSVQPARDRVVGAEPEPFPAEPVVLDEGGDRGGVGQLVADVVLPGPGRDHQHRQPLAVAAPVGIAAQRHGRRGAEPWVRVGVRAVHHRHDLVVVPAVGVVPGDHDGRGLPVLGLLDLVDRVHQERLLVQRVGVAGMAVLVLRGLQVADRWHVPVGERGVEVGQVVLVVGLVGVADGGLRRRRQVLGVGRGLEVLERVVVRRVVGGGVTADVGVRSAADRVAGAVGAGGREPALEPAPADAPGVEQVADVLAGHDADRAGRGVAGVRAVVVRGV